MPHFIAINPTAANPTSTTTPAPATFAAPAQGSSYSCIAQFLPIKAFSSFTNLQKQQVLNGISPISQSFILSINNSQTPAQITAYQISGIYDSSGPGYQSTFSTFSSAPVTTVGDSLGVLNVSLDGTNNNVTFNNTDSKIPFTATDLANGIILNVIISTPLVA